MAFSVADISVELMPLTVAQLAKDLAHGDLGLLVLDIRQYREYCTDHIHTSENVNFSTIVLRRLLKRLVQPQSVIVPSELAERVCGRSPDTRLVLYDGNSSAETKKQELVRHATALCRRSGETVYFVDGKSAAGGSMNSFSVLNWQCDHQ